MNIFNLFFYAPYSDDDSQRTKITLNTTNTFSILSGDYRHELLINESNKEAVVEIIRQYMGDDNFSRK